MGGVPSRACRRFIRRLADERSCPSTSSPTATRTAFQHLSHAEGGLGNAAHLNEYFCVPQARYLGVTPDDINEYKLPTHPLKEVDKKRAAWTP